MKKKEMIDSIIKKIDIVFVVFVLIASITMIVHDEKYHSNHQFKINNITNQNYIPTIINTQTNDMQFSTHLNGKWADVPISKEEFDVITAVMARMNEFELSANNN